MYVDGNAVKSKTEAESNDMTECSRDDQPNNSMFFPDSTQSSKTDFILCAFTLFFLFYSH